jgi:hypothetical protein
MSYGSHRRVKALVIGDVKAQSTVAWVAEGDHADGYILVKVISPGGENDHSSYSSELTGIYDIMYMMQHYR